MSYHKFENTDSDDKEGGEPLSFENSGFLRRCFILIKKVVPSSLQFMLFYMSSIVNLAFVGHLSNPAMVAALGVSNMMLHICVLSNVFGFNSAMDTLVSQAAGAKNLNLCGQYLNKARFLMTMMFVPIIIVLSNSERILIFFKQNEEVAKIAQQFIFCYMPGIYLQGLIDG